ncbi:MAG TPA: hypothetical protein VGQ21_06205 [Thermoanaerobaculia bacterium]|jgi:ELWxxDGT repeat protein|nr:hypothetical protein [Thermoanaerobaculia bacterium]
MRKLSLAILLALVWRIADAQSPYLVKDINATTTASAVSSNPNGFFRFGSRIFFAASGAGTGSELWSTDGSDVGTALVADINTGSPSSSRASPF